MTTEKTRENLKKAFRLAINKARTLQEARKLNKIRSRMLSGEMSQDEAFLAIFDLTLVAKPHTGQRHAA